jgi:hypothetical protein
MKVLGFVWKSERREKDQYTTETGRAKDIEAFFYPDTCCLGFQGHPEYAGYYAYTQWCLAMIEKYVISNPDVFVEGKNYRHRPPIILGLPAPIK